MFARILVEVQQPFQARFQASRRFHIDFAPVRDQLPRQFLGRPATGGPLNRPQPLNRLFVLLLRQFVQYVAHFMQPTKLLPGHRKQLAHRRPEA
jgi:hypothetical protein